MAKFEEVLAPGLTIRESANDGSDFTNPTADYRRLFLGEDGELHVKDSSGTVTSIGAGVGATVATDAIWDAAGDLAVGSGANTAARLAKGATDGMVLKMVGGAVAWAFPPAWQLDYVEKTTSTTVTGTSEASPTTIVTGTSQAYAAEQIMIEFYCPELAHTSTNAAGVIVDLWEDSTPLGRIATAFSGATTTDWRVPVYGYRLRTPTAATHQYIVKAWKTGTTTASLDAGAGGTAALMPAFIRVRKAT
jgi:hypothetical protein